MAFQCDRAGERDPVRGNRSLDLVRQQTAQSDSSWCSDSSEWRGLRLGRFITLGYEHSDHELSWFLEEQLRNKTNL